MTIATRTASVVDAEDVDRRALELWGRKPNVAKTLEAVNDSYHGVFISEGDEEATAFDQWILGVDETLSSEGLAYMMFLLQQMGELPQGIVVISVWW